MATKRKIIQCPPGKVPMIAQAHSVTTSMVYNALNGNSNSLTAQLIRKEAVSKYGGVETTKIIF